MRTYIQLSIDYEIFGFEIGCHVSGAVDHFSVCCLVQMCDVAGLQWQWPVKTCEVAGSIHSRQAVQFENCAIWDFSITGFGLDTVTV